MGEYFGFGVLPCSLIEDIRHRIKYALAHGAKGFTARVDWEALPNHSVFDTINALNVYACAMLSLDSDLPAKDLYEAWLSDYELFAPGLTKQEKRDCIEKLASCVESVSYTHLQPYIVTARAKGLRESQVIRRHAMRLAMNPLISMAGLMAPKLLNGIIMTEMCIRDREFSISEFDVTIAIPRSVNSLSL